MKDLREWETRLGVVWRIVVRGRDWKEDFVKVGLRTNEVRGVRARGG